MESTEEELVEQWLKGEISLGTLSRWDKDEVRVISELGYLLSLHNLNEEAIKIFEGLNAVVPDTPYFQSSLGALYLRAGDPQKAIGYFDRVLDREDDIVSLINRGEAYLIDKQIEVGCEDLKQALVLASNRLDKHIEIDEETTMAVKRARALLKTHDNR